jgi:trans-2,3-dihydro-3-hydroxyanthranilate isomerase
MSQPTASCEYDVVDVFTDRPFAGNQLAVVHGAEQLSTDQCLALAREFNFSETTFPGAVAADGRSYPTRIFTPGGEIPFAGHPTLGTAWVLRERGQLDGEAVTQHCGAGPIGVAFLEEGIVELAAVPRDLLGPLPASTTDALLTDLGLAPDDLAAPAWLAGCGLTFVHLPVVADAVARAQLPRRPLGEYADGLARLGAAQDPVEGINVVHVSGSAPELDVHARVFVPDLSVPEDPATGSAAAGLGVALVAGGFLPEGGRYRIRQGLEMGRPSLLQGAVEADRSATGAAAAATRCRVGGQVQPVARGRIGVPAV